MVVSLTSHWFLITLLVFLLNERSRALIIWIIACIYSIAGSLSWHFEKSNLLYVNATLHIDAVTNIQHKEGKYGSWFQEWDVEYASQRPIIIN